MSQINQIFRQKALSQNKTLQDILGDLQMSNATFKKMCKGEQMNESTLIKIAKYFNTTADKIDNMIKNQLKYVEEMKKNQHEYLYRYKMDIIKYYINGSIDILNKTLLIQSPDGSGKLSMIEALINQCDENQFKFFKIDIPLICADKPNLLDIINELVDLYSQQIVLIANDYHILLQHSNIVDLLIKKQLSNVIIIGLTTEDEFNFYNNLVYGNQQLMIKYKLHKIIKLDILTNNQIKEICKLFIENNHLLFNITDETINKIIEINHKYFDSKYISEPKQSISIIEDLHAYSKAKQIDINSDTILKKLYRDRFEINIDI